MLASCLDARAVCACICNPMHVARVHARTHSLMAHARAHIQLDGTCTRVRTPLDDQESASLRTHHLQNRLVLVANALVLVANALVLVVVDRRCVVGCVARVGAFGACRPVLLIANDNELRIRVGVGWACACAFACVCVHVRACMRAYVYVHACLRACMHACVSARACMCARTCRRMCIINAHRHRWKARGGQANTCICAAARVMAQANAYPLMRCA